MAEDESVVSLARSLEALGSFPIEGNRRMVELVRFRKMPALSPYKNKCKIYLLKHAPNQTYCGAPKVAAGQ